MPRRSRPAYRRPPTNVLSSVEDSYTPSSKQETVRKLRALVPPDVDLHLEGGGEIHVEEFEEGSSLEKSSDSDDDDDADAPRVAQWVDDDEMEIDEEDRDLVDDPGHSNLRSLQSDLSGLPLGTLRHAQNILERAEAISDSERSSDTEDEVKEGPQSLSNKGKDRAKERVEWSLKPRYDISKRSNKHAPAEVTSKRPVSRKRTVVEVPRLQPRDPRFLPSTGQFSAVKFQKQYGFLVDAHAGELQTLKESLKRARKLLDSSPQDLLEERQHEVNRLEQAVKRAESLVNRDRLEKVEREALSKLTKEEKEKRNQGKRGWWLKQADKREILMRARFDALAAEGGTRAVKKAIEKKLKKVNQKEKKSRPFPKGVFAVGGSNKRALESQQGDRPHKRRRM